MWQNVIFNLTRNPLALKALFDVISPMVRGLVRQETSEDITKMRQEVDAFGIVLSKEMPMVIGHLNAQQKETAQALADLRWELREAIERQEQREIVLRGEIERTRQELAATQADLRRVQEAAGLGPLRRRWWPW